MFTAAETAGDHHAQAAALDVLGLISYNLSDYQRAIGYQATDGAEHGIPHWHTALGLFTEIGTPEADEIRALLPHSHHGDRS